MNSKINLTMLYNNMSLSWNASVYPDPSLPTVSPVSDAYSSPIPFHTYIILTVCYIFMMVVGVSGNATVIAIIGRHRDMRSTTNIGMLSLSVADLLVLLVCMPAAMLEFYGKDKWILGEFMCKYEYYIRMNE